MDKIDDFALTWLREYYASENARKDAIFETVSVPMSGLTILGGVQAFWFAGFAASVPTWKERGTIGAIEGGPAILKGFANAMTVYSEQWLEFFIGFMLAIAPILLGIYFLVLAALSLLKVASGNEYALAASPQDFGQFVKQAKEAGDQNKISEAEVLAEVKRYLIEDLIYAMQFNISTSEKRLIYRKKCFDRMARSALFTLFGLYTLALAVFGVT